MVRKETRKRTSEPLLWVEVCFGCGALVDRNSRVQVEIWWAEGNPGGDEVGQSRRGTRRHLCIACSVSLHDNLTLVLTAGRQTVKLFVVEAGGRWMTKTDHIPRCQGMRLGSP